MNPKKIVLSLIILLFATKSIGCPITIINDSNTQLFIVDRTNDKAVRIAPRELHTIDTSPQGFFSSLPFKVGLSKEKMFIYVETPSGSNTFALRFQTQEKFCTDNDQKNTFKFSEIAQQSKRALERFYIKDFKVVKKVRNKKAKRVNG